MAKCRLRGDHMRVYDELHDGHGRLLARGDLHEVIGEVEVIYESRRNGKKVFTRKIRNNDLLVTGAVFLSEKVNNVRSTFLTTPLDFSLGIHNIEDIDRTSRTVPQEHIVGFCIGNGGCGDVYNTVHKVHRTDLTVPGMIPFRVVPLSNDLQGTTREQYFLRTVRGDYAYYYGKKFGIEREINVQYEDGTIVPVDVNLIGDSNRKYIKTFTKFVGTVDEYEVREYFKLTEGSTMRSLVNSVGLATGYLGVASDAVEKGISNLQEVFNARTITTLNTENGELKDSEATIKYTYKLFFT